MPQTKFNAPTRTDVPDQASDQARWSYAPPANGISNTTTAVTVKAATTRSDPFSATTGLRNYVTSMTVSHGTLGAATELAIRDGAAGTVLYRTLLHTTAMPTTHVAFDMPLVGTANTLLEIVTLTAVTGNVLVNLTGYVGE
jgi:hypothetical protein